jgi:4-diphosphocytidyl-2-C-methyl-D-erythritol kinase
MISLPSFAKVNLGLKIGPRRPDGFHELRTVYQTLVLHDVIRVEVRPGWGIEIRCEDPRVPCDESNTCYKIAVRLLALAESLSPQGEPQVPLGKLGAGSRLSPAGSARDDKEKRAGCDAPEGAPLQKRVPENARKIIIEIEKQLPVQGGLGAASSNAVATMLALERALGLKLAPADRLRTAAEVGSDLPLFLIGGTVLGVGRGEEVSPLPDLPRMHVVVVTPPIGVSTPKAFARWDELNTLTGAEAAGTLNEFSRRVFTWLGTSFPQDPAQQNAAGPASGVPALGGDRAETPLLDLVRAGIENDFERVVFPEYPELREVKELLLREGAQYASLSGSGSTLYGLFASKAEAQSAAERMSATGHKTIATTTLTRAEYWEALARAGE